MEYYCNHIKSPQPWENYMGMEIFHKDKKSLKALKSSITFSKNGSLPWREETCISRDKFHEDGKVPQASKASLNTEKFHIDREVPEYGKFLWYATIEQAW